MSEDVKNTEVTTEVNTEVNTEANTEVNNTASDGALPTSEDLLEALKVVKDPEIPINVVDLGLIYRCEIDEEGAVEVDMTLTSMGCPVQDMIQADAEMAVMQVEGVKKVTVEFVWSPPWSTEIMTDDGKKQMRMFGFSV